MAGSLSPVAYTTYAHYVRTDTFGGIYQEGDGFNVSVRYAAEGKNFDTTGGGLKSMTKGTLLDGEIESPIGTLAMLYRRFYENAEEREVMIAAAGGNLYAKVMPDGWWEVIREGLQSDSFDYVSYEVNPEGSEAPVDVLLLTNALDGMLCVYGNDLHVEEVAIPNGKKFGILARHAERIWGGGIPDEPDTLMYSAPYDPFNWQQNDEIPEDGAGDVMQPSWDGDSFVALRPFGAQLIALKKNRVWRILGTNPGNYVFKEQFGGGTIVENTVAVRGNYMFMLGYDGLMYYDGAEVSSYQKGLMKQLMARVNMDVIDRACAVMRGDVYCLALPVDGSEVNNVVLEYNIREGMFNLREGMPVRTFMSFGNDVYFTSDETPGQVWKYGEGEVLPFEWVSAWQDLDVKNATKSGFTIYLCASNDIEMKVGIRTEKKLKEKTVKLVANKAKRLQINNSGRQFRVELACNPLVEWELLGGLLVNLELDYD